MYILYFPSLCVRCSHCSLLFNPKTLLLLAEQTFTGDHGQEASEGEKDFGFLPTKGGGGGKSNDHKAWFPESSALDSQPHL